jgi:hypothetical protein
MNDSQTTELLEALKGIQRELQQINKTLSNRAASPSKPAPREFDRPSAPSRGAGRDFKSGAPTRSAGAKPYRSEKTSDGFGSSDKPGSRFGSKSPSRPRAGKPPAKKGSGYPKKSR